MLPSDNLVGGGSDGPTQFFVENTEFDVHQRCALFYAREYFDELGRDTLHRNPEMLQAALCLGAPQTLVWDGDLSQAVFLDSGFARHAVQIPCRSAAGKHLRVTARAGVAFWFQCSVGGQHVEISVGIWQ
jgi:hypothetical protein